MKNLIKLITAIFMMATLSTVNALDKVIVQGELVLEGSYYAIYTDAGRLEIESNLDSLDNCFDGLFELSKSVKEIRSYKLLKTINCRDKFENALNNLISRDELSYEDTKGNFCPMDYNPVCGIVTKLICDEDQNCESKISFKTFSNNCLLKEANAKRAHLGHCEDKDAMLNREVLEVETFNTPDLIF